MSIMLVCGFCHENLNHVEDDEEIMPEEANLAKASKELGVAEVVGVVQDHWAHLVKKTIMLMVMSEKIYPPECWRRPSEESGLMTVSTQGQSGPRAPQG